MNNLLKSISISLAGAFIFMITTGCTPGRAQTRGNDYKGSFQNEEFEAFDNDRANDDTIPAMNKNRSSNSNEKYADNTRNYNNNSNFRVKSSDGNQNRTNNAYQDESRDYGRDDSNYQGNSRENYSNDSENYSNNEQTSEQFYQKGTASWYGREFHGKTTASGERFDMNDYTAAHKTLPFGSVVEVTNLDNGKAVRLRINDRGPYRGSRIIDLSFGGARELDMVKVGEANVGIKVLKLGDNKYSRSSGNERGYVEPVSDNYGNARVRNENQDYSSDSIKLQAGAFFSRKNAENLKARIESMTDRPVKVIQDGDYFKVRIEGLRDKREMGRLKSILSEDNINSFSVD